MKELCRLFSKENKVDSIFHPKVCHFLRKYARSWEISGFSLSPSLQVKLLHFNWRIKWMKIDKGCFWYGLGWNSSIQGKKFTDFVSFSGSLVSSSVVYTSGDTASLPCDISVPQPGVDDLTLVMWYREDVGSPIYSIGKTLLSEE